MMSKVFQNIYNRFLSKIKVTNIYQKNIYN